MHSSPARRPRTQAFLPPPSFFLRPVPHFRLAQPRNPRPYPCANLSNTPPAKQYVPLHVHSDFSLLDGASQLPNLVSRAAELGVPALALTDHGVLYGAIELLRECEHTGVKPIIGNEMYLVNDLPGRPLEKGDRGPKRYHLIVLAKNTTGYRNLVKLTTMAHLHGKVGKGIFVRPCINKDQLFQYREGLIVSSACLGGEIPQAILNGELDEARSVATWYRDAFGDDFYLEIQDHGSEEDKIVNPEMINISKELGIKFIATNDSHFTNCLDAEAHDTLICIQTGKLLTDENRLHYSGKEYFKSVDEMRENFIDHLAQDVIDDALHNTLQVAEKVDKYDLFGETRIPDFPIPEGFIGSHDDYLRHNAYESLHERLKARQETGLADPKSEKKYYERLDLELDMIAKMGFSSYFLVVWDYIRHAKELNIPVGPGRGSVAGSLVAFALRITDVDPIPFNLLFERFLNPERKSMPDIDTDFSVQGRERIISYVSERYGADHVAQIITFNRLTSKAVLKDVARVHSVPYSEADRLAKLIPVVRGKPAPLAKLLSEETPSKDFKNLVTRNPPYRTWIDKAMRIEGTNKTFGIHAAGVVISATPLTDAVPLSTAKHGETITQYSMEDVESLGLLKMDFLGLKNLTVIETALTFINEGRRSVGETDLDFSVDTLPLDDAKTYKLLCEGELDGIFQLDASAGMRSIVRELRPSSLEDISSILALYRPGPLDAGLIPKFIRRKHNIEPIEYDHPLLEPILKETYGIMVYQEQIMRIARDLAGYSLGQADILRRAMGKKKTKDMEREKPRFISGAKERGVPEAKATELFDMMIKFAEYCFNKSHSTAYAYLTYQTAYLKANYPIEYSAALLRSNMNQSDKLVRYLADANVSGVKVLPPSVNKSELGFTVDRTDAENPVVLFGLEAVKTVGASVSEALLAERQAGGPFRNILDLAERVNLRVLNKRAMGALVRAGAFDGLHGNRKVLYEQLETLLAARRKLRDKRKRRDKKELSEEEKLVFQEEDRLLWEEVEMELAKKSASEPDFSFLERLAGEKATMGFYASGHPLYDLHEVRSILDCARVDHLMGETSQEEGQSSEDVELSKGVSDGTEVMVLSCITELKMMTTAKGKKMAKWNIEDSTGRVAGIVFPGDYDIVQQMRPERSVAETASEQLAATVDLKPEQAEIATEPKLEGISSSDDENRVVKEDARVVVWGKVDHQSSGSTQIILNDVQRVEDVQAVVVTAASSGERSSSTNLLIVRHSAAEVLGVSLYASDSGTYTDAKGEQRKRWPKRKAVSEKNRIPLILKSVDTNGEVISHTNVGNNLRFPTDCADLILLLEKRSGFSSKLISIGSDVMGISQEKPSESLKVVEDVEKIQSRSERGPSNSDQVQLESNVIGSSTIADEVATGDGQEELRAATTGSELFSEPRIAVASFDEEAQIRNEDQPERVVPNSDDLRSITPENGSDAEEIMSNQPLQEVEHERLTLNPQKSSQQEASRVIGGVSLNAAEQKEHETVSKSLREAVARTGKTETRMMSWKQRFVPGRATSRRIMVEREEGVQNIESGYTTVNTVVKGAETGQSNEGGRMSVLAYTEGSNSSLGRTMTSIQQEPGNLSLAENVASKEGPVSTVPPDTSMSHNSELPIPPVRAGYQEDYDVSTRSSNRTGLPEQSASQDCKIESMSGGFEMEEPFGEGKLSNSVPKSDVTISNVNDDEPETLSLDSSPVIHLDEGPSMDLSNGVDVNFDNGFAAILDSICLVAGDVAQSHSKALVHFEAISGVDTVKITEQNVVLSVSGQVAFVNQHRIFILIELKEKSPSGQRKRCRSFGKVTVAYQSDVTLDAMSCKTKKSQKIVEGARKMMEASSIASCEAESSVGISTSNSRKISCYEISHDLHGNTVHQSGMWDGGEFLLWMSRAAVVGAKSVLASTEELQVVSMDGAIMTNLNALKEECSLNLRVYVEGVSSGRVVVRVEVERLGGNGNCRIGTTRFWVRSLGDARMKNSVFENDEGPLFSDAEAGDMFGNFARSLTL